MEGLKNKHAFLGLAEQVFGMRLKRWLRKVSLRIPLTGQCLLLHSGTCLLLGTLVAITTFNTCAGVAQSSIDVQFE